MSQPVDLDNLSDEFEQPDWDPSTPDVHCEFLTGQAGTGKTTEVQRRVEEDPSYGQVTATTGIAAVNLGTVTLNSFLGYFDTESMMDALASGRLQRGLSRLLESSCQNIIVDEVSMMPAEQLDVLHQAVTYVNRLEKHKQKGRRLGIVVTGDFCQLPPVKARWAFEADCWPQFEENTTRLETVWRHQGPGFLDAMQAARRGDGEEAAYLLGVLGVEFAARAVQGFPGTSIAAKNDKVEAYNFTSLLRLRGRPFTLRPQRWGEQRREWLWNSVRGTGIPDEARFKVGATVMVLANDAPCFTYCNGDLASIEDVDVETRTIALQLFRNDKLVVLRPIERLFEVLDAPQGREEPETEEEARDTEDEAREMGAPFYSWKRQRWVIGGVKYFPMRLGYASTVHKTQGLTLDRVQIDIRGGFFSQPNMAYVALSRVRTPEGMRIVGSPDLLARKIQADPAVARWV